MEKLLNCTTWNNTNIYKDFDDPKIQHDIVSIESKISELEELGKKLSPELNGIEEKSVGELAQAIHLAQAMSLIDHELRYEFFHPMSSFAYSSLSVNSKNEAAADLNNQCKMLGASLAKAITPLDLFLKRADDKVITSFFQNKDLISLQAQVKRSRKFRDYLLSPGEEVLVAGLAQDGLYAWGELYKKITGGLKVDIGAEIIGYAKAANILRGSTDRNERERAYLGIKKAFETHEDTVAAILNSLNGWRLEVNQGRSHTKELHYLDVACMNNHIERETLTALIDTTYQNREIGHRAIRAQAKLLGVDQAAPWDLLAPCPGKDQGGYTFTEAIDLIAECCGSFDPEMGEFIHMMAKNNWIDAKESENRDPGAYCMSYPNVREPRVFMTFNGSMGNVMTLAHELGHAWHNWVMRDMPIAETKYSMATAETASIFAETLVRDTLFARAKSDEERLSIAWQDAESASAMICNIPSRFKFEQDLVEGRKKRAIPAAELKEIMSGAWKHWYEDSLSEYDEMFWASKLHFSIAGLSFYNFPYLFGYLFSLSIYAQKDRYGNEFAQLYRNILRDTGVITAEELIEKYLGQDIKSKDFWQAGLATVDNAIKRFEHIVDQKTLNYLGMQPANSSWLSTSEAKS